MKRRWWWRAATLAIATGIVASLATLGPGHRYRYYLDRDVRLCWSALQFLTASERSARLDAVAVPVAVDDGIRTTLQYRIRNVFAGALPGTLDCDLGPATPDRSSRVVRRLRIDGEPVDEATLEQLNRSLAGAD